MRSRSRVRLRRRVSAQTSKSQPVQDESASLAPLHASLLLDSAEIIDRVHYARADMSACRGAASRGVLSLPRVPESLMHPASACNSLCTPRPAAKSLHAYDGRSVARRAFIAINKTRRRARRWSSTRANFNASKRCRQTSIVIVPEKIFLSQLPSCYYRPAMLY